MGAEHLGKARDRSPEFVEVARPRVEPDLAAADDRHTLSDEIFVFAPVDPAPAGHHRPVRVPRLRPRRCGGVPPADSAAFNFFLSTQEASIACLAAPGVQRAR